MSIRIAALGVSHWHSVYDAAYLRHLARMPDVELVGVQDDRQAVAQRRAAEVGNPPAFDDAARMLDTLQPDFVIALGRHDRMARIAHDLLDRGLPFMMEKPMGLNAVEVQSIAARVLETGAFVAVPMPQRLSAFARHALRMLRSGQFGPLSHLYIRTNRFTSARYPAWDCPWMLDPAASGGGCLRNLGMHGLDIFLLLTGGHAQVTGAQIGHRALETPVEDYATVLLRTPDGICGTLEVGNTYPRRTTEGTAPGAGRDKLLDGADGEWKIAGRDALLMAKDGNIRIVTADGEENFVDLPSENPAARTLADILSAWRDGRPPPVGVHDCLKAVRLIDDAYLVATAGI
ncbi:oxidoreductase, NAD-binding Rossmann fold family protein [Burkholderia cenocepacia]|uniref:Oxidoreductase, NAD-binding Rossmann fold family protein n=1 Tax=Burkholderia cenocepacia TaxID=95486 RepID=A0AAN0RVE3_9BURK|nr:oxidoreductase, NAD-binding Rossmann fold family protein [Burkholderia cenocepacia]